MALAVDAGEADAGDHRHAGHKFSRDNQADSNELKLTEHVTEDAVSILAQETQIRNRLGSIEIGVASTSSTSISSPNSTQHIPQKARRDSSDEGHEKEKNCQE